MNVMSNPVPVPASRIRPDAALDQMLDIRASSLSDVMARAKALVAYDPSMADPGGTGSHGHHDDQARAVIRDLLALDTDAGNPDAELIAACNRYLEIEDYFEARYGKGDIDDNDPALWEQPALLDKAVGFRASTLHGHVARAKLIGRYFPLLLTTKENTATEDKLVAALLHDLIGEARA